MKKLLAVVGLIVSVAWVHVHAGQMNTDNRSIFLSGVTANISVSIPAGYVIRDIIVNNHANSIVSNFIAGSTNGATNVIAATKITSNFFGVTNLVSRAFSPFNPQPIFFQAANWNSAVVDLTIPIEQGALSVPSGQPYLGVVATREMIPDTITGSIAMSRSAHLFPKGVASPQFIFPNFYVGVSGIDLDANQHFGTNPRRSARASLEYPIGTCTQMTWGGASTITTSDYLYPITDPVNVSIPPGATAFVRIYTSSPIDGVFTPVNVFTEGNNTVSGTNVAIGDGFNADANNGSNVPDQTTSCDAIVNTGGDNGIGILTPIAILGQTTQPSVLLLGDSIQQGYQANNGGSGQGQNAAGDAGVMAMSIGPQYGYINAAVGGTSIQEYVGFSTTPSGVVLSNSFVRQRLYKYVSNLGDEYGLVDIALGRIASQVVIDQQKLWFGQAASGPNPATLPFSGAIFHSTLTSYTSANVTQILSPNTQGLFSFEPQRKLMNSWYRTPGNVPNGVWDIEPIITTTDASGNIVGKDAVTFTSCAVSPYWFAQAGGPAPYSFQHPSICADQQIQNSGVIGVGSLVP